MTPERAIRLAIVVTLLVAYFVARHYGWIGSGTPLQWLRSASDDVVKWIGIVAEILLGLMIVGLVYVTYSPRVQHGPTVYDRQMGVSLMWMMIAFLPYQCGLVFCLT